MSTLPRMNYLFRDFALVSSALTLIFFCSCERHHPDELPAEHVEGADHAQHGAEKSGAHEKAAEDQHHAAPGTAVVPIPTSPAPTPAEFFPENSPR